MAKVTVKIWYPTESRTETEKEIEIPDGIEPEDWIYDNQDKIIEDESMSTFDSYYYDVGYVGVQLISRKKGSD